MLKSAFCLFGNNNLLQLFEREYCIFKIYYRKYLANLYCKGPKSKYFRATGLYHNYLTLLLQHESKHRQHVNKHARLCANKTIYYNSPSGLSVPTSDLGYIRTYPSSLLPTMFFTTIVCLIYFNF